MSKFLQGFYKPINPHKVKGDVKNLIYRSSWELKMFHDLDLDDNVIKYSSEEVVIGYRDCNGKLRRYFVDFYVERLVNGQLVKQLIEIKPYIQTIKPILTEGKKTKTKIREVLTWDTNKRKWEEARRYCDKRGWQFLIMTEYELGIKKR